nr:hypothetical protein [Bacteroidota bacterium]
MMFFTMVQEQWNEKQPGSVRLGWPFLRGADLPVGDGDGLMERGDEVKFK